jgi:hypothetical protein
MKRSHDKFVPQGTPMNRAMRRARAQGKDYVDSNGPLWTSTKKGRSRKRALKPKPELIMEWISQEDER